MKVVAPERSDAAPRHHRRARQTSPGTRSSATVVGALVGALGVVVVADVALGVHSVLAMVAVGYVAFVAIVAVGERTAGRASDRPADVVIDLTLEEAAERGRDAVPESTIPFDVEPHPADDIPIRRRAFRTADVVELAVAALASAAGVELLRIVIRMESLVGFSIWWFAGFIALYFLLARERSDAETALDRVVTVLVWSIGSAVAAVLVWMIVFIVGKGLPKLAWSFFTHDLSRTGPLTPGGGAKHSIIGTLEQVGIAAAAVVPIGILTAVYLNEIQGRLARPVRFIVDAMSGLPSIVAGLLVFTVVVQSRGYSGVAGSAALAVLMLPTMTRASEEILRTVPHTLREGALALGSPQWRLVQRVVLPTALSGLVTAALLAIARAIGETAPMLLTSFGNDHTNTNPLNGPQSDLPLFVWKLIHQPYKTQVQRAMTGSLVLVMLVFVAFVGARLAASRGTRKLAGKRR